MQVLNRNGNLSAKLFDGLLRKYLISRFAPADGFEPPTPDLLSVVLPLKLHRFTIFGHAFLFRSDTRPTLSYSLSENRARLTPDAETNPKKPNYVFKIPATTFGHRVHI